MWLERGIAFALGALLVLGIVWTWALLASSAARERAAVRTVDQAEAVEQLISSAYDRGWNDAMTLRDSEEL